MSNLAPIIRFKKWTLDEERRSLAVLYDERLGIEEQVQALEAEMASQRAVANTDIGSVTIGAYIEAARAKQAWLLDALHKKDAEIEDKQDVVREAFKELKTFEVADEKKRAQAAKRLAEHEQKELDERGLRSYQEAEG